MGKVEWVYKVKRWVSHIPGMTSIVYHNPNPPFAPFQPIGNRYAHKRRGTGCGG
jgi:hypothetical protein